MKKDILSSLVERKIMERKPTHLDHEIFSPWVDKCNDALNSDGIILFPTDTIWGLGCDATNEKALNRLFELKKRPKDKPFVLLARDTDMIEAYVQEIHPRLGILLEFHQRPLSVVYANAQNLPAIAIHENQSVAFRIPKDDFCQALLSSIGKPIVATSANISGEPFPAHFGEISSSVISGVDFVVPYRQQETEMSTPSVMVTLSPKDEIIFLRE